MFWKDMERVFLESNDRVLAIRQLGLVTRSDEETIIEALRDHGLCVKVAECKRCRRVFPAYISPYCYECEQILKRRKELKKLNKAILEFEIKRNATRKKELIREMISLDLELERLKEELNA